MNGGTTVIVPALTLEWEPQQPRANNAQQSLFTTLVSMVAPSPPFIGCLDAKNSNLSGANNGNDRLDEGLTW
jgi:hypothetical protein